jgi:hypothetical protein
MSDCALLICNPWVCTCGQPAHRLGQDVLDLNLRDVGIDPLLKVPTILAEPLLAEVK